MIHLKSADTLKSLMRPMLREILGYIDFRVGNVTITSLYRPEDRGIHSVFPLRAVDIRCWDPEVAYTIASMINQRFEYDPERPEKQCAIPHGKDSNFHIHLQVHDRTQKISLEYPNQP